MARPTERVKFSLMTWVFLVANGLYGLGFLLLGMWTGVSQSSLYQSLDETWSFMPEVWGGTAFAASVLAYVAYLTSRQKVGSVSTTLGLGCWLFATWTYLLTGFYLVAATVGMLYLMFWIAFWLTYVSKVGNRRFDTRL